jgi:hypothetical protein
MTAGTKEDARVAERRERRRLCSLLNALLVLIPCSQIREFVDQLSDSIRSGHGRDRVTAPIVFADVEDGCSNEIVVSDVQPVQKIICAERQLQPYYKAPMQCVEDRCWC